MSPNITDTKSWHQANLLLQPIFIRLIDHFRKYFEDSQWTGEYQNRELWPESVAESVKLRRQQLLQILETIAPEAAESPQVQSLKAELETLPSPYPGYELLIFPKDQPESLPVARFDLWELCYKICFCNYSYNDHYHDGNNNLENTNTAKDSPTIVDQTLLDEIGEVEWNAVDEKTAKVVADLFERLAESPLASLNQ